ncbi:hypothetical protein BDZ97DRAFT_1677262 [Flammula alnicola]|nr:hypothetical protein BDZ97DRAFT_1677262 [Flammula alnicola]
MSDPQRTIFFLGATGFIGSQFLVLLSRASLNLHVVALTRDLSADRQAKLKEIYPDIEFVKGTLNDADVIIEQASKAKYVVNCASSDHPASVQYILTGLEKQSANKPGDPPLYFHTSGMCIVSDNARGEAVDESKIPRYTDTSFSVESVPPENPHVNCDSLIAAAGSRKENPVRTIIAYPGWVYGLGEGFRKSSGGVRLFLEANKMAGYSGTWGPGHNSMTIVHIKDLSRGLITIFEAALQGKADEGPQGYYFVTSNEPRVPFKDYTAKIGDMLHGRGVYAEAGSKPFPPAVTDIFGDFGWRLLGCNHRVSAERLKKLGWEATESRKISMMDSLPEEVDMAFIDLQPKSSILRPEDM